MKTLLLTIVLDPDPVAPPGLGDFATDFLAWVRWGALIAGVVGLIFCAVQMMAGRRNRSAMAVDGAAGIPWVVAGLSIVAISASVVTSLSGVGG